MTNILQMHSYVHNNSLPHSLFFNDNLALCTVGENESSSSSGDSEDDQVTSHNFLK